MKAIHRDITRKLHLLAVGEVACLVEAGGGGVQEVARLQVSVLKVGSYEISAREQKIVKSDLIGSASQ